MSGRQGWSRWQPDSLLTWRDGRAGTGDDYWRETRHCAVLARWEARQSSWSLLGGRAGDSDVHMSSGGQVMMTGGEQLVKSGTGGQQVVMSWTGAGGSRWSCLGLVDFQ